MSKPIFIVRLPIPRYTPASAAEMSDRISKHSIMQDYHVLVIADEFTGDEIKFECFNAPHTEIEFEELKSRLFEISQIAN